MEIGEVLDLGQRKEPADRGAEGEPEDGGLVEQRVEDAAGAEARVQPARDAVDAALRGDVLAEEKRFGMRLQCVAERTVDRERERQRLGVGGSTGLDVAEHELPTAAGERGASGRITRQPSRAAAAARRRARPPRTRSRASRYSSRSSAPVRIPERTSQAAVASSGSRRSRRGSRRRAVGGSPRRRRRARGSRTVWRWSTAGRRVSRTQSASSRGTRAPSPGRPRRRPRSGSPAGSRSGARPNRPARGR